MKLPVLLMLTFFAAIPVRASSLPAEVIETMDQYRLVVYLSETQINSIPPWKPGDGQPPMSLQATVDRVLDWIARNPLLADAQIYELKYKPVHHYETSNLWYYLVELRMPTGKKRFVAVLPDGQVVPAINEPDR